MESCCAYQMFNAVNHQDDPLPDQYQNLDRHLLTGRRAPLGPGPGPGLSQNLQQRYTTDSRQIE